MTAAAADRGGLPRSARPHREARSARAPIPRSTRRQRRARAVRREAFSPHHSRRHPPNGPAAFRAAPMPRACRRANPPTENAGTSSARRPRPHPRDGLRAPAPDRRRSAPGSAGPRRFRCGRGRQRCRAARHSRVSGWSAVRPKRASRLRACDARFRAARRGVLRPADARIPGTGQDGLVDRGGDDGGAQPIDSAAPRPADRPSRRGIDGHNFGRAGLHMCGPLLRCSRRRILPYSALQNCASVNPAEPCPSGWHLYEQPPHPALSPEGERVEKGWRGEAEPYPEMGSGVIPDRKPR